MSATDRKRRQRLRESNGQALYAIAVDEIAVADMLINAGLLQSWAVDSKGAVTAALEAYVANASRVTSAQAL